MEKDYLHKVFPATLPRDAFWQQVKRTVNGQPVSESDIQMIVDQVHEALNFTPDAHLLDLGSGNAALGSRFFNSLNAYTGVDFSEYLLGIAREYFAPHERISYFAQDIREFVAQCPEPEQYSHVLCYGCVSYLGRSEIPSFVADVWERLVNVRRLFVGNIPDRSKAQSFFSRRGDSDGPVDDPQSPIGVWWNPDEFRDLWCRQGFQSKILRMPDSFYGASYRFDLVAERPERWR